MAFIITENCTGCTACMKRCPTDAITGDRKLLHVIDPELCIDCGACGVVCPDESIFDQNGILCEMLKAQSRPLAYVDLQACVGCEWCVWACPFDALEMKHIDWAGPDNPAAGAAGQLIAAVIEKKCVGCTLCELDCPYDAIHIWKKDSAETAVQVERNARFREEVGIVVAEPQDEASADAA
jgi:NAD-dependent dihydropyrimidine dehydrogenase PreA subunit